MRANRCGTPQGGVISPLLANLYLDGLDKAVNTGREMQAVMVRYADDFVVLCRAGRGSEVYRRPKLWLERRKLKLNEEKTRVVNFEEEGLEFLGFQLSWRKGRSGRNYPHCEPSAKSAHKLREAVREETARATLWKEPEEVIGRINQRMRGWVFITATARECSPSCNGAWRRGLEDGCGRNTVKSERATRPSTPASN